MVAVTNMMSLIVYKIQPTVNVPPLNSDPSNEIDDKTRAIIEAAIKMHTQR
jgi:oxaloacetate decarboxylase gamma subunit